MNSVAASEDHLFAELPCSAHLLDQPELLRKQIGQDGYAYFRGVLPTATVHSLRREILSICAGAGWIAAGDRLDDARVIRSAVNEGEPDYFLVYDEVQRLESFHALPHHPAVRRLMVGILGESVFPHPLGIARLMFPDNDECTTPPHQDYPNNQGTPDLYACWIPLGDCPAELGGIAVLERSHKLGVFPLSFSLGAGGRQAVLPDEFSDHRWLTTDFCAGDALVFHSQTVHRSLHNRSGCRLRLSCDYRFQRQGEGLVERCLQPHFGRLSWQQIYSGWKGSTPRRYWEGLDYRIDPWDESYHRLPDDHLGAALKLRRAYEARRTRAKPQP